MRGFMDERVEFGKIKNIEFGSGGYQDACIGVSFQLGGESWGVGDFWGAWATKPNSTWTHDDRLKSLGESMWLLKELMDDAKVDKLSDLMGKPVKVYFKDFNKLSRWEIFKEVL
jgi:hypothetical protein